MIYLKEDRLRPKNVRLSAERLERLKASWTERLDAMTGYATEDSLCRSRYLLKYFGQEESRDCGTCDICRMKTAERKADKTGSAICSYINGKGGEYTLEDINVSFGSPGSPFSDNYLDILRKLIDDGKVPPYRM